MVDLYKLISDLCEQKGVSGGKMCADIGVSRSFMTELKKGRAKTITFATAQKLADYFNVSVDYFDPEKEKTPDAVAPRDEKYNEIIEFANETDEHREVMEAYVDNYGWYKQLSWKEVEERYQGKWDSEEDFAEHLFDELYSYEISDFARRYFDMEAFARDLFSGDYVFVDGHVFSER